MFIDSKRRGSAGNLNPHLARGSYLMQCRFGKGSLSGGGHLSLSTGANAIHHWPIGDELLALLLWWNQRGHKKGGRRRRGCARTHQTHRSAPFVMGAEVRKSAEAACWCTSLAKSWQPPCQKPYSPSLGICEWELEIDAHKSRFHCFLTTRRGSIVNANTISIVNEIMTHVLVDFM